MTETCRICGISLHHGARVVLVSGGKRQVLCSEECLQAHLEVRRKTGWTAPRRLALPACLMLALIGFGLTWQLKSSHLPRAIISGPPETVPAAAPTGPPRYGPPWPPSDEDWRIEFARAVWAYPLPGPTRRPPTPCPKMFGVARKGDRPAECRTGRCGVDLGGDIWGEHVLAAHDGVVDRVQRSANDEHGGLYVRLSHWSGMVYTQYFHLAAVGRGLAPGVHVKAGEIIGLLGDTGVPDGHAHLHFALSIRPSFEYPETYWDPQPEMASWPVPKPPQGSVVGLVSMAATPASSLVAMPRPHRKAIKPRKQEPAAVETEKPETEPAPSSD